MRTTALLACAITVTMTTGCFPRDDEVLDEPMSEGRIDFERTTQFDGRVLTVDLAHRDGRTTRVDTVRDAESSTVYTPEMPNHSGRAWQLMNASSHTTSLAYALVAWDNEDPTSYMAAGWWMHFPGQLPYELRFGDNETWIFIDGPEIDPESPPTLPLEGRATYAGTSGGVYYYRHGSDAGEREGLWDLAEFAATMSITADFAAESVEGCVGCVGPIVLQQTHLGDRVVNLAHEALGDRLTETPTIPTDFELQFATTHFNRDGTFESDPESPAATVVHPDRPIVYSEGFWGGHFSNRPDENGDPRLVAGFYDALFVEAEGGGVGYFEGMFNSLSDAFRQSDRSDQR